MSTPEGQLHDSCLNSNLDHYMTHVNETVAKIPVGKLALEVLGFS